MNLKTCIGCYESKDLSNFDWTSNGYKQSRCKDCQKIKRNSNRKVQRVTLRKIIFTHYCNGDIKCLCPGCDIKEMEFLTIEHKKGNGKRHREDQINKADIEFYRWIINNNFPNDLTVLCYNCNCAKRARKYCPVHQKSLA